MDQKRSVNPSDDYFTKKEILKSSAKGILVALLGFVLFSGMIYWSNSGREYPLTDSPLYLDEIRHFPADSCGTHVVLIQPWMTTADYSNEQNFRKKIFGYIDKGLEQGLIPKGSLIVFTEHIGTWLVAAGEKKSVIDAPTIQKAMTTMLLSDFFNSGFSLRNIPEGKSRVPVAIFRYKSPEMRRIYRAVFSEVARRTASHVIAGSIVEYTDPKDSLNAPGLYNVSYIFNDGGAEVAKVFKAYPTSDELDFLNAYQTPWRRSVVTPVGLTQVFICADSWQPHAYLQAKADSAWFVAVPSFITGTGHLQQKWQGYDGCPTPEDVAHADIGNITEAEAWDRYALPGRLPLAGTNNGCNVFLRGELWDLGSDGHSYFIRNGELLKGDTTARACILSACFQPGRWGGGEVRNGWY